MTLESKVVASFRGDGFLDGAIFALEPHEADEFAFYLLRDGEIVWRGSYSNRNTVQCPLTISGTYTIKGFLRRNGAKRSALSNAVQFDGGAEPRADAESHRQRFEDFLSDETASGRTEAPFYALRYPHHDFLAAIVNDANDDAVMQRLRSFSNGLQLHYRQWTLEDNHGVHVVSSRRSRHDDRVIFAGTSRTDEALIFGDQDLDLQDTEQVRDQVGDFALLEKLPAGVRVTTDYFGVHQVYYYDHYGIRCASNRYHLLLLALRELGAPLTLNRRKAAANLSAANQPFAQNFSSSMEVNGVQALPPGRSLTLSPDTLELHETEIDGVLRHPSTITESEYEDLLPVAAAEVVDNLRVALNHPAFDSVRVDVTGGMDARMVYAALSSLSPDSTKVHIHTADTPGSPLDLAISLYLTSVRPFQYDRIARVIRPERMSTQQAGIRSVHMGSYYGWKARPSTVNMPRTLRINGFYGEVCARPYYARLLLAKEERLPTRPAGLAKHLVRGIAESHALIANRAALEEELSHELEKLPGRTPLEKWDLHYLFYRNGLHCSDRWLNEILAPGWGPLQSKTLFKLKMATFHEFRSVKLQLDVTDEIDLELSRVQYGRERDNAERESLMSSLRHGSHVRTASAGVADDRDYRTAALQRTQRTTRARPRDLSSISVENSAFSLLLLQDAYDSLRHILNESDALTESEARQLFHQLQQIRHADPLQTRHSVLINKLLSLSDQLLMCSR